jgi:outer membrane protein insertion porin family
MLKTFFIIFFVFLFTYKSNSEIITGIKVVNNDRISKETILIFSDIEIGKDYSVNDLNKIIQDLYSTNFFSNISLDVTDGILIIDIQENKIIQQITINGIKKDELVELLKKQLLSKDKNPFVENHVRFDINRIKKILENSGYYFSDVTSKIIENDNSTVELVFDITIGEKAFIRNIQFIGDKYYKDRVLRNIIASEEARFWKFLSKKKYINPELIELDKRLLKNHYLNKGHYHVIVNDSFIEYTDNNDFKLVYNIEAGPKFTVDKASLDLPLDYNEKDFVSIIAKLKDLEGEFYSLRKLNKIAKEVEKLTLRNDYEFLDASFIENIISENKINLIFEIKEFKKEYLTKINIFGNNITEEKVVRDNLAVDEGDPFNKLLLAKSINNLKSLNIFGDVNYELNTVDNNKKILDITIEEKPTGEISAAAGAGTQGSTFGFGIKENNFLGKNIMLDTNLRINEETIRGQFSIVNPNWNYTDKVLSTTIESSVTDRMVDYGYKTNRTGFSVGSAWEQYDDVVFSPSLSSYFESLNTNQSATARLKTQEGSYFDTAFAYGIDLDKRNQRYQTSDGFRSRFNQRIPLVSDDFAFLNSYEFTTYNQFSDMVTRISIQGRTVNSLNNEDVRISKRLFIPSKKLRGFQVGKVGPIDSGDFIGGNHTAVLNASTTLPEFGANLETIDFQIFFDAANVWGVDYNSSLDKSSIRSSAGISVDWFTIIGPLNFSVSQSLSKANTDKTETFRFNIGTTF